MQEPFFSIIIPSYNRAHIILNTISTVQRQSFTNWECIIVDDGSTDNTKEIIAQIQDERVKYIYQNNAERSAARNNGAQNAKGKYICFLDSDDEFLENHLQVLYDAIQNENEKHGMYFVHAFYVQNGVSEKKEIKPIGENLNCYLLRNPIIPARTCIRKDVFSTCTFDEDIVIVEDLILWLKIADKYSIKEIKEHTINYILHDDNSVNLKNNSYLSRYNGLKIFESRYKNILSNFSKSEWKRVVSNTIFGIAKHHIFHSRHLLAAKYTSKAILKDIKNPQNKHRLLVLVYLLVFRFVGIKKECILEYRNNA